MLDGKTGNRYDPKEMAVAKLKLGVELASFRLSIREALPAAAEVGADAVEIDARGEITPKSPGPASANYASCWTTCG